ncbi:MAG: hypothetical protein V7708_02830 [Oceanicoccus sp.]
MNRITLTRINSTQPKALTKRLSLAPDGSLVKKASASLTEGHAEVIELATLDDFVDLITALKPSQALCYGRPVTGNSAQLVTKAIYETLPNTTGVTTRTNRHFGWPEGGGVLMVDYDPPKDVRSEALTEAQLIETLRGVVPELSACDMVWMPSAGSNITNEDTGEPVVGITGQRVYVMVKDARDIERAGKTLCDRLWLAGFGHFEVSKSAQLLDRPLIDNCVWQPSRLDFAAGAACTPPLTQTREPSIYSNAAEGEPFVFLDTSEAIKALTKDEQTEINRIKNEAKMVVDGERLKAKADYIESRAAVVAATSGEADALSRARELFTRAIEHNTLGGDFPLTLADADRTVVTVGEVMDNPARYHGKETLDPLEPDYEGGKVVGRLYLMQTYKSLHSFAHGGRSFKLFRQPRRISIAGAQTSAIVDETLAVLRDLPEWFDMGDELVVVDGSGLVRAGADGEHALAHYLSGEIQYFSTRKVGDGFEEVPKDPPLKMVKALMQLRNRRHLKKLNAVINAPTITPDGELVTTYGYHEKAGLFLVPDNGELLHHVPHAPTDAQVLEAVETLMHPFREFKFAGEEYRGGMLAALLSVIVRPAVPTSPMLVFDAPHVGSGKSLLMKATSMLATGKPPAMSTPMKGDELAKTLFSALREGRRLFCMDNVEHHLKSPHMAETLTSASSNNRVLGLSSTETVVNRMQVMLSGTNISISEELTRRSVFVRIDADVANPFTRQFDFCPVQAVRESRQRMVAAGLTIMRGWLASGAPAVGATASFEEWDNLVRQSVIWVGQTLFNSERYADPQETVLGETEMDEEGELLTELFERLEVGYGRRPFKTSDVVDELARNDHTIDALLCELTYVQELNKKVIGRLFLRCRDQIRGCLKLTKVAGSKNPVRWKMARMTRGGEK